MNILGIGSLCSRGYGVESLEKALNDGLAPQCDSFLVDLDGISDRTLLKKLRRADRFSKMSVLAAAAALQDSNVEDLSEIRVGILLSTAFGAHVTTFDFLDGIIDYGEANVSPTAFSNSVHNAAASYVASSLGIKGPTLTVSRFSFPFQSALQLASAWLEQGRCDYLLLGSIDQHGDVLDYLAKQKLPLAKDGVIKPFIFSPSETLPGEGALFLLLGRGQPGYCAIDAVTTDFSSSAASPADLTILDSAGFIKDESKLLQVLQSGEPVTSYTPLYGGLMTGAAFSVAAAAITLRNQKIYAAPEQTNPHNLNIVTQTARSPVETVRTLSCGCNGDVAAVILSKK
ncbi:MAG: beta-ketoacyl synthase chain length factor [Geobacteraceae bacterium]|nr:beta-ketoacyl synthase chain length factor [Geobacteraceae bacterium]